MPGISPIKSIPFLNFSRDRLRSTLGITYGRGSFAVHFGDHLRSRDHLPLGIICGTDRKEQFFYERRLLLELQRTSQKETNYKITNNRNNRRREKGKSITYLTIIYIPQLLLWSDRRERAAT